VAALLISSLLENISTYTLAIVRIFIYLCVNQFVPNEVSARLSGNDGMRRVRIFYEGQSSQELHWLLERQTPEMRDNRFRDLHFVTDQSYQHAIFMNGGMTVLTPTEDNACYLMEPPEKFRPSPHPAIGTLFSFNREDEQFFGNRFSHHHMLSFLHTALPNSTRNPIPKTKHMSMVVSGKVDTPCQRQRVALMQALLQTDLPIDFYGRDLPSSSTDPRIIGSLPRLEKSTALATYTYSIAFENSLQDGYLTEKFLDCIVNQCIPITNNPTAVRHFPAPSYRFLDMNQSIPTLIASIHNLMSSKVPSDHDALHTARTMALSGTWSFAQAIHDFVNSRQGLHRHDHISPQRVTKSLRCVVRSSPSITMESSMNHQPLHIHAEPSAPSVDTNRSTPMISMLFLSCRRLQYLTRTVQSIREHVQTTEPHLSTTFICFDNGSAPDDRMAISALGFDLLTFSKVNRGIGPAMNHLVSQVRSPYLLNLQDDWTVTNPHQMRFLSEAIRIMENDPRISQVKLDTCHFLDFHDRTTYAGPFQRETDHVPYFVQNPQMLWGGFCFPPALTRVAALHQLGPFREDRPFQRGWAESEYSQRYATKYVVAKSPSMLVFEHIGVESTTGWTQPVAEVPQANQSINRTAPSTAISSTPTVDPRSIRFIIAYSKDSPEREANVALVEEHLRLCIQEARLTAHIHIARPQDLQTPFQRTKVINDAARSAHESLIATIDADVIIPKSQILAAINQLAEHHDMVYPYEGFFLDVPRSDHTFARQDSECRRLLSKAPSYMNLHNASVGGAIFFRKSVFWSGGGMNEHFDSWGRDDVELYARFSHLGYNITRIPGPLFHLHHPRDPKNQFYQETEVNARECERISSMPAPALLDEIATWQWAHA
jgi:hypothetical protein